jgi:hypothetical protein
MRILIKYIDFHMDNHQGGSGRTIEGTMSIDAHDFLTCGELFEFIHRELALHLNDRRPFGRTEHGYKPTIVSMEIV